MVNPFSGSGAPAPNKLLPFNYDHLSSKRQRRGAQFNAAARTIFPM
jgi:hypothetical protein